MSELPIEHIENDAEAGAIEAIYFDGKSSKSHRVSVRKIPRGIQIESADGSDVIFRVWEEEDIESLSVSKRDSILLSYGGFPSERLEASGPEAQDLLKSVVLREAGLQQAYYDITRAEPVKLVIGGLLILAAVIFSYVKHVSPFVGEQAAAIVPRGIESKIGDVAYGQLMTFFDVDEDKSEMLQEFYNALDYESDYEVQVEYVDASVMNAFAVPGGKIVVFDGLVDEMESWEELAALLSHELAHVNERHSLKQLARSISGYLLLSAMTSDVAGMSTLLIDNASTLSEMAYSRSYEQEADIQGLGYMKDSGVRAEAMTELFSRFAAMEEGLPDVVKDKMEFLTTHPLTEKRIAYIKDAIASKESYNSESNPEAEYLFSKLKEPGPKQAS